MTSRLCNMDITRIMIDSGIFFSPVGGGFRLPLPVTRGELRLDVFELDCVGVFERDDIPCGRDGLSR